MLSESFQLYYQNTLALVQSLSIKFEIQNTLLNTYMTSIGLTVDDDERTWKYNMNLAGLYHPTDVEMKVISLDTKEEIVFNIDNLDEHPRTKLYYTRGEDGFNELVSKYPRQEILIAGITNGLDLDTIVQTDDWQILKYDSSYISANELTIIDRVQAWINRYVGRFFNDGWLATNPYYATDFIGMLAQNLITVFMVIRADLAGSEEACQFEIWSELSGHYGLDAYKTYLTTAQSLWVYRNIVNIRKNAGKQRILESFIDELLTPDGLILKRLDYYLNETNLLSSKTRDGQYSLTQFDSRVVNQASGDVYNTTGVYGLTANQAPDNSRLKTYEIERATKIGARTAFNTRPTKILRADEDSSLITQNVNLLSLKVRYWVYLGYLNLYTPEFSIDIPNSDTIVLGALDAFRLFVYAGKASLGTTLTDLPTINVGDVLVKDYPTASELLTIAGYDFITRAMINSLLEDTVSYTAITTLADFTDFVKSVHAQQVRYDTFAEMMPNQDIRGNMWNITNAFIQKPNINLASGSVSTYTTWLFNVGIEPGDLTQSDWWDLSENILSAVVDYTNDETSVGAKQKAIVEIIGELTSYHVMLLEGTSSGNSTQIDWPDVLFSKPVSGAIIEGQINDGVAVSDGTNVSSTLNFDIAVGSEIGYIPVNDPYTIDIAEDISVTKGDDDTYLISTPSNHIFTPNEL